MTGTYQTNGLVDLIGRRATWGQVRVRIVEVHLVEDVGAIAVVVEVGKERRHRVNLTRLRLVPLEQMPKEEAMQLTQNVGPLDENEDEDEEDFYEDDEDDELDEDDEEDLDDDEEEDDDGLDTQAG